jgi:hypothetical protein
VAVVVLLELLHKSGAELEEEHMGAKRKQTKKAKHK